MQVNLGHTAQPQILARATPWRTCGVARQCAPQAVRWKFLSTNSFSELHWNSQATLMACIREYYITLTLPSTRARAATVAAATAPPQRVPGLYPRDWKRWFLPTHIGWGPLPSKHVLPAVESGWGHDSWQQYIGWACAMRCFFPNA